MISPKDLLSLKAFTLLKKIKQYSEMERMGVKAFFIHFLVNIIPSAITFDKNGFITEKWLYNTVSPKKISVYLRQKESPY